VRDYVGSLAQGGDLRDARRIIEEARLFSAPFTKQQVQEYGAAIRAQRRPRSLHPWVPGLYWHALHRSEYTSGPLPAEVLMVFSDMLALKSIPQVLPVHADAARRRIRDGRESALWEIRVAGMYVGSDIRAEWSAVSFDGNSAPDVWLPEFNAEIQVKCLDRRAEVLTDLGPVFNAIDDAYSQVAKREVLRGPGPSVIVIAVSGAKSLKDWEDHDSVFYRSMDLRMQRPEFRVVSALVFAADPVVQIRPDGQQLFGYPSSRIVNNAATYRWSERWPLTVDEQSEVGNP
jgi:hypothetical protein